MAPNSEEECPFKEAGLGIEPSRASHEALNGFAARGQRQPPLPASVIMSAFVHRTAQSSGASHAKGIVDGKVSESAARKNGPFGLSRPQPQGEHVPPAIAERLSTQNPSGDYVLRRSGIGYRSGGQSILEILHERWDGWGGIEE